MSLGLGYAIRLAGYGKERCNKMFVNQSRLILEGTLLIITVWNLIGLGSSPVFSQRADPAPCDYCNIKVSLSVLDRTSTRVRFQATITNAGTRPVLIVTSPVRVDGSAGPYIYLNTDEPSLLELGFRVFPPPGFDILARSDRVTYTTVAPDMTHQEELFLQSPMEETEPPWRGMEKPQKIDLANIQYVKFNVGVLPDEPEVREAFARERSPTGLELVKTGRFKGKSLFNVQRTVSSEKVKL